jgi:hypothetical protein
VVARQARFTAYRVAPSLLDAKGIRDKGKTTTRVDVGLH